MNGFKFPKRERICAKSDVDLLFAKSKFIRSGVLSIRYILRKRAESPPAMALIVVPKKKVKHAVNRNRIKRQLRELYRLNKVDWEAVGLPQDQTILIAIQYGGPIGTAYSELEKCYLHACNSLMNAIRKDGINKN